VFFFTSRRRHTRFSRDWSSDVCSSDLLAVGDLDRQPAQHEDHLVVDDFDVGEFEHFVPVPAGGGTWVPPPALLMVVYVRSGHPEIGRASCREREESWRAPIPPNKSRPQ